MQKTKRKRTLIKFATQNTVYTAGEGSTTSWQTISVPLGNDELGNQIVTDCFYCEWLNSYGNTAIEQQADGVIRSARVRMTFVLAIYNALISGDVRIYKNGVADDKHTFCLASAADNYIEDNKMLEFQVKKYEVR
ncbi:MAG: hypothetical protein RR348_05275 [Clostridia bacterium]